MERIVLNINNTTEVAERAAGVIKRGGVVLFPTDTLYGLGANAFSDEAVAKTFQIKGRNEGKPVHAIVTDIDMASMYGRVRDDASLLISKLPKGQVTFIVGKAEGIDGGIAKGISTFGFRIPDDAFCMEMLRAYGAPVTATSANRAGETPQRSIDAILEQLGSGARYIDFIVDAGELPARKPSSVVDLSGPHPRILREGAVSTDEIKALFV